jgi:hypothetical protein
MLATAVALLLAAAQGPADADAPDPARAQQQRARLEKGPWLELDAGVLALRPSGEHGLSSGPGVRFALGLPLGEAAAAELWASGTVQSPPQGALGDQGAAGGGLAGRLRFVAFDAHGTLSLWGRAGAGYLAATTPGGPSGPSAFVGAILMVQPPVKRFAFGLEVDAVTVGAAPGFAVLPTLRCSL